MVSRHDDQPVFGEVAVIAWQYPFADGAVVHRFFMPVRGELTIKPPREADRDHRSVSANRSYSTKSADLDRLQPLLPVCLR